jgi:uncharacterized repeat protein (TIGR03843 family)
MPTQNNDITLNILSEGKLSLHGEFMWGSNYTYLLQVEHKNGNIEAVYKPTRGVRPLWDFPSSSLARREVAAHLVSQGLGWNLVPPTVYRKNGPFGPGSLQLYIDHNPEYHYFNFTGDDRQRLRPVVLFDLLINNADRKGSHVLIDESRCIWLIDHGLSFHVEAKLRTVIWDFAGEPLPENLCADLTRVRAQLAPNAELSGALSSYLSGREIAALAQRADTILNVGRFPDPDPNRRPYPWPPV